MARRRLDAELVRRSMARSREHARELIEAGAVKVKGAVATKAATQVDDSDPIVVDESAADHYVSRGAHKLIGALEAFDGIEVAGRDCLDAGASTGGFTQVLLERGAARVLAVDVGYGQLAWPLRTDERVTTMDRTNVRGLAAADVPFRPSLIVADLSFIPLEIVLPALQDVALPAADLLVMVKPQFEVGREAVGDGVVRDPELRRSAVLGVARAGAALGLTVHGVAASPLPGPSGNVEYFLWLRAGREPGDPGRGGESGADAGLVGQDVEAAVQAAVAKGPQ
ncbi:TlyA family RNA methyltransferase [bacterium]|nr:TlyA family RNA methyltransferase [bacterium]